MQKASSLDRSIAHMVLGVVLYPAGHHVAAWHDPSTSPDAAVDVAHYRAMARIAEAAALDFAFVSDRLAVPDGRPAALARVDEWSHGFEALTLAAALAASTTRIGIVATASTSFNEPFTLARQLASLDLLSGGRAGWNLVTSSLDAEALNYNPGTNFRHADRYERAGEFLDVVLGLWQSWEPDAFLRDRASGVVFDPDKLHRLNHEGRYFRSRGPLNVPLSPQGRPVVVQAGSSEAGRALAARTAEMVFTAQPALASAQNFTRDLGARAAAYGRSPDAIKVLPGLFPVLGRSEAEAQDKFGALQDRIHPDVALALLETYLGDVDLSPYRLDGPLPDLPESNSIKSRQSLLVDLARREGLTIRELARRVAGARGHCQAIGTPVQVADQMEHWFRSGAADGFAILPPTFPAGLDDFTTLVVPELRRRGLFRSAYTASTLRDHLGLPHPEGRKGPSEPVRASA